MKNPHKLFLISLLTLVSLASAAAPSTGQFLFQRRTATGPFDQFGVAPITGQVFGWDGANVVMIDPTEGSVSSVGLTAPSIFSVVGSPVTSSGTLALSLTTQSANRVWAGPSNGSAATPTFRLLLSADIPDLSDTYQPFDSDLALIAAQANTSFGLALLTKADGAAVRTYIGAGTSSFDGAFASLTGKPTTLAGYGITDADALGAAAAAQAFAIQRSNHTGTQAIGTITGIVPAAQGGAGTLSGLLKANGSGTVSAAAAGTDYLAPAGSGAALTEIIRPTSAAAAGSASSTGAGGAAGTWTTPFTFDVRAGNGGASTTAFNGGVGGSIGATVTPFSYLGGTGGASGSGANGGAGGSLNAGFSVSGGAGGAGGTGAVGGNGGSQSGPARVAIISTGGGGNGGSTGAGGNGGAMGTNSAIQISSGTGGSGSGAAGGAGGAMNAAFRVLSGAGGTGGTAGAGAAGGAITNGVFIQGGVGGTGSSTAAFAGGVGGASSGAVTITGGNGGTGDGAVGGAGGAAGGITSTGGTGGAASGAVAGGAGGAGGRITLNGSAGSGTTAGAAAGNITLSAIGTTAAPSITCGNGTPEAVVTAPVASLFLRMDGGAATCLYVKESGTGNTGWVAK